MKSPHTLSETLGAVKHTLQQMSRWGTAGFACSRESQAKIERWTRESNRAPEFPETLQHIRADLGDCQRCGLAAKRSHIVFGEGDPSARLVFVGEGPGHEEDRSGRPFVGAAGQLLSKIIEAMKLRRDQIYICNVIKCRPPGNRNPEPDEITACRPFLERQLTAIAPQVICTLGAFAAQSLLNDTAPISRLRGRFHDYNGIRLMPTFHPAYLLRNPDRKREVWDDMKKIMAVLRVPL
jgi:uracil-DNA glycosylase family 4